jgi:membrane AbrB-like protein
VRPRRPAATHRAVALGLGIAAVGGMLAALSGLPLAWMLGALVATTAAALGGARAAVPGGLRTAMVAVLGIMLGSAFTPQIFADLGRWLYAPLVLVLYLALVAAIGLVYFRRLAKYDPITAYFSAMPGGLSEMAVVGEALGGDARTISLVHSVRILLLVLTIPLYFRFVEGLEVPTVVRSASGAELGALDAAILVGCAVVGYVGARRLRLPAAPLVGPMVLSAAVHLSGLTASAPPALVVALAQVVVGGAVGCRFAGLGLGRIWRDLKFGLGSAAGMIALTVALAAATSAVTGSEPFALALALAPGGLAEMSLIALALGADSVFVSAMHILRIAIIVTVAPLAARLMPGRRLDDKTRRR